MKEDRLNIPEHSERSDGEHKSVSRPLRQFLQKALHLNQKLRVSSIDALCEPVFNHWAKRSARVADDLNEAREETQRWRTHVATQVSKLERDGFRFQNFELQLPHRQYRKRVLPFPCELNPQSERPPVDSSYSQNVNVAIQQAINSYELMPTRKREPPQPAPKLNPDNPEVAGHLAITENALTSPPDAFSGSFQWKRRMIPVEAQVHLVANKT